MAGGDLEHPSLPVPREVQDSMPPHSNTSDSPQHALSQVVRAIPSVLWARLFPAEKVMLGVRVSRWLRSDLLQCCQWAVLRGAPLHSVDLRAEDFLKTFMLLHHNNFQVALVWSDSCCNRALAFRDVEVDGHSSAMLQGLSMALQNGFGSTLTRMEVSANVLHDQLVLGVQKLFQYCSALTHLTISGSKRSTIDYEQLGKAVAELTNLTHLDLSRSDLRPAAGKFVVQLSPLTSLQHLDLSSNQLGDRAFIDLQDKVLARCSGLHTLNLAGDWIRLETRPDEYDASVFASLSSLDLSDNRIGIKGARFLARALGACSSLSDLNLHNNQIAAEGVALLCAVLEGSSAMVRMDLGANDKGCHAAASTAEEQTVGARGGSGGHQLTWLDVSEVRGLDCASVLLGNSEKLRSLSMAGCAMGCAGAVQLGAALLACGALEELELSSNELREEGGAAVGGALPALAALRRLSLRNNALGSGGAAAIAAAIQQCPSLAHCDVGWNAMGADGVGALLAAAERCSALQCLDLSGVMVGCEGMRAACAAALGRLPTEVRQRVRVAGRLASSFSALLGRDGGGEEEHPGRQTAQARVRFAPTASVMVVVPEMGVRERELELDKEGAVLESLSEAWGWELQDGEEYFPLTRDADGPPASSGWDELRARQLRHHGGFRC